MSTCFGDSSDHGYTSIPMSKSSSSTSHTTIPTSPEETSATEELEDISPLEGLEGIHTQLYKGIPNMQKIVKSQYNKLEKGDSVQQYLVFERVSTDDLAKIDRIRDSPRSSLGKRTRMTYYTDRGLLIVKLPTAEHEAAHGELAKEVVIKLGPMGALGVLAREFHFVGAIKFTGRRSSKEGDSAYRPLSRRPNRTDWPTIVFESGFSESLSRLRFDAEWWLKESGGRVKIVIIISMKRAQSMIRIEKWELAPMTGRRLGLRSVSNYLNNNNVPPQIPTKIQEITIVPNPVTGAPFTVTGAPLVLEFEKIFLRPAVLPEIDITFTGQELSAYAATL